ncbi:hypothetical protein KR093_011784 [Drosophila rubida]|uniref:tRNA-dihydrouridine(20) synthase [NAD(P)+]-like n=1 Tax=Drosophila rubida TaxID=30044 RepID=A0AAD4K8R9_9MUSC|nr:hypothetical protein KR093_011784 [Drosophila rubida]
MSIRDNIIKMSVSNKKSQCLDYKNKLILAPMVRVGTLPMRLLALEMGADIVYTEELVDLKLIKSVRRPNPALDTIDFVDPSDGTIVFRTCALEKSRVVLQLGTSDASRALTVSKLVEHDIAGIDINMGCPKEFSIKGGMGAALLAEPDKAAHILSTLCSQLDIPVTCKIRILPDIFETIKLVQQLAATGIAAIGVHARTRDERPQHRPHPDVLRALTSAVDIPIIANGGSRGIHTHEDIYKFQKLCGADSVMIARAAQQNVSIFRREGLLPIDDVICKYLRLSVDYDNAPHNTKYCVQSILKELQETARGKRFLQCQTLQQICEIWQLGDYCRSRQQHYKLHGNIGRSEVVPPVEDKILNKRRKVETSNDLISEAYDGVISCNMAFLRSTYPNDNQLPKTLLYVRSGRLDKEPPSYETRQCNKLFRSICSFDGQRYSSSFWEKNKRQAEQGAALVALFQLGLLEEDTLRNNGSLVS